MNSRADASKSERPGERNGFDPNAHADSQAPYNSEMQREHDAGRELRARVSAADYLSDRV